MPERVQIRRDRKWQREPKAIKVDRTTIWGNPFKAGEVTRIYPNGTVAVQTVEQSVELYRHWIDGTLEVPGVERPGTLLLDELAGRDLACWCALGAPCHADVLLEIANATSSDALPGGES